MSFTADLHVSNLALLLSSLVAVYTVSLILVV